MPRAFAVEIDTVVLGGFPVRVRGVVHPADPDVGYLDAYVDDICISTMRGRPASFITSRLRRSDLNDLATELLAAA